MNRIYGRQYFFVRVLFGKLELDLHRYRGRTSRHAAHGRGGARSEALLQAQGRGTEAASTHTERSFDDPPRRRHPVAPLHEVCVVYSGVGCGLRSYGPSHPLPPTPRPPPAVGPPPHQLSGQGGRVDGINEQAGDRARVGPPPYHHPFIPTTPSCHHARPSTPAWAAQGGGAHHHPFHTPAPPPTSAAPRH